MRHLFAMLIGLAALAGCGGDPTQSAAAPTGTDATTTAAPSAPSAAPVKKRSAELAPGTPTDLFVIDWGDIAAVLEANGGPQTTKGSVVDGMGLNFRLVDGNDVRTQVAAYKAGTTPYLRLTSQQALDVAPELCATPDICPLPVVQQTWSTGGDHAVAVDRIATIADLKGGVTIALQDYGPHGGLLVDVIETDAKLSLDKVKIVKAKNLTGDDSPVSLFQQGKVDAAFVITPDMFLLTAGGTVGTGAEGSVKGAHEILSTAERTRSIADLFLVNPQYYASHKDEVVKFAVSMIKGQENVVELKKAYDAGGSDEYRALLQQVADLLESVPDGSEADAAGLVADCSFVGHPGNVAFFADAANPTGWSYFNKRGAEVAVKLGYSKSPVTLPEGAIDWNLPIFKQNLAKTEVAKDAPRFDAEKARLQIEQMADAGTLLSSNRLSFSVYFEADQTSFDAKKYEAQYKEMIELSHSYKGALMVIRAYADPTPMLLMVLRQAQDRGIVQVQGNRMDGYQFFMDGRRLDTIKDKQLLKLGNDPRFGGWQPGKSPADYEAAAKKISTERAEDLRTAMADYAKAHKLPFDVSQVTVQGAAYADPVVVCARSKEEAALNRRGEFMIVPASAETLNDHDFEF